MVSGLVLEVQGRLPKHLASQRLRIKIATIKVRVRLLGGSHVPAGRLHSYLLRQVLPQSWIPKWVPLLTKLKSHLADRGGRFSPTRVTLDASYNGGDIFSVRSILQS